MHNPKTLIIAEAGVNHNGDLERALQLIDAAAEAGADIVKFQTFKASKLASADAPKASYQTKTTDAQESQLDMLKRLELSFEDHQVLLKRCAEKGITFLSTPFDSGSLTLLTDDFGLKQIKLGSGELTNGPFLMEVGATDADIILSTGMGTLSEVEEALGVLAFAMGTASQNPSRAAFADALADPDVWPLLRKRVTLLHCTTEYPAVVEDTNLRALDTLRSAFGLRVGYSDHTNGIAISLAAVARGACVIEKHFTLDRTLPGPDHAASSEPEELAELVRGIRAVEQALGTGIKQPGAAEYANRAVARKSLIATKDLAKGHMICAQDVTILRPGTGQSPMAYWDVLGTVLNRDVSKGSVL